MWSRISDVRKGEQIISHDNIVATGIPLLQIRIRYHFIALGPNLKAILFVNEFFRVSLYGQPPKLKYSNMTGFPNAY